MTSAFIFQELFILLLSAPKHSFPFRRIPPATTDDYDKNDKKVNKVKAGEGEWYYNLLTRACEGFDALQFTN